MAVVCGIANPIGGCMHCLRGDDNSPEACVQDVF